MIQRAGGVMQRSRHRSATTSPLAPYCAGRSDTSVVDESRLQDGRRASRRILSHGPGRGPGHHGPSALRAAMGARRGTLQARVRWFEARGAFRDARDDARRGNRQPGLLQRSLAGARSTARAASARRPGPEPHLIVPRRAEARVDAVRCTTRRPRASSSAGSERIATSFLIDAPPIPLHPEARPLLWQASRRFSSYLEAGRSRKGWQARALRPRAESGQQRRPRVRVNRLQALELPICARSGSELVP
jgi:hypothetical protein